MEISAGYKYTRGNFSFVLPDPNHRFEFFVRELAEMGQQKPTFNRWLRAEVARAVDRAGCANVSFFIFDKNKIKPEKVAENNLKWYVGDLVYSVLKKTESGVQICGDRLATKRVMDLDINNGNKRRIAMGWFDIDLNTCAFFSVSNYGRYSEEPAVVLETLLSSVEFKLE